MSEEKEPIDPFRFKVSGNIIKRLGSESISNPNVAILELVKNSYDAGATSVEVIFSNIGEQNPKIIISDDGTGMDYEDIEHKWMVIAADHKSQLQKGKKNRILVGEKGLGRLASESLGKRTTLRTMKRDEEFGYEIHFNWEEYKRDIYCDEVKNASYKFKKSKSKQGTEVIIENLKHDWNDIKKLESLFIDVQLLTPITNKPRNFKIKLDFGKIKITIPNLKKEFLDTYAYRLKARLSGKNIINYEFSKGNKLFAKEKLILDSNFICGDVELDLYFFYRDKDAYKDWINKKLTNEEIKFVTGMLDNYSGIKIYRDSFRVKPYGDKDKGYDWIDLEKVAQDQTIYPRLRQLFGLVFISKNTNKNIVDTTTREGIIYTDEFRDLINFVWLCISKIFVYRRSEAEPGKKKARKSKKKIKKIKVKQAIAQKLTEETLMTFKGKYPQNFYDKLENDINNCYGRNHATSTFVLCRKMVENFVLDILKKKYPKQPNLYLNTQTGMPIDLSVLIKNLFNKRNDMKTAKQNIETFNQRVGEFRKDANKITHRIAEYLDDRNQLKKYKIPELIQLLVNIWQTL